MKVGVDVVVRNKAGSVKDPAEYFGLEPLDSSQVSGLCRFPQ